MSILPSTRNGQLRTEENGKMSVFVFSGFISFNYTEKQRNYCAALNILTHFFYVFDNLFHLISNDRCLMEFFSYIDINYLKKIKFSCRFEVENANR